MANKRNQKKQLIPNQGIAAAINALGSQLHLANAIGVTQPTIFNYLYRKCPIEKAIEIEAKTGVKRESIRPDVFARNEPQI